MVPAGQLAEMYRQGDVTEYVDPYTGDVRPLIPLNKQAINDLLAGTTGSNSNIANGAYSVYVSNVLNITPKFIAMLSLRADYFDSKGEKNADDDDYNQFAVSPKVGLLYQLVQDKVSVFGNYMNAFLNVSPAQVFDLDGNYLRTQSFNPKHANQFEFRIKADLLSDKLYATLSFYDIIVSDRVIPDAANPMNSAQLGKVGSTGFEIDLNANPVSGLNIIAGYSHNSTKVIEGNSTDFYSEPGRAPGGQGPQHLINAWATYKFTSGKLRNFGIGIGGNAASSYKVIDNSVTGIFYLLSYTLLNGGLFYNSNKFRVALNINNITDEIYYIGYWSVNPQKPRNFTATVAYKF